MTSTGASPGKHEGVREQVVELAEDLESEVKREMQHPADSSQSDALVRKHVTGLAISFFVLIGLFLIAAIVGIVLYTHS